MASNRNYVVFQVVANKADAKLIRAHCRRKKVSVSGFFRRLALMVAAADPETT